MEDITRRSFLGASLLMPLGSLLKPPRRGMYLGLGAPNVEPMGHFRGLEPNRFLEAFDWGKPTVLADGRTLREYSLQAVDRELEVAPGVVYKAWTYNGTVPGPTLRCHEGDRIRVRFRNESIDHHTIHFHGIHPAGMDGAMEMVEPGQEFVYEFDAEPAGLLPYHCHAPPVGLHIGRGLFGALIVDPRKERPRARELVMVIHGWDLDFDGRNELYALNGPAHFYRDNPIRLRVGEPVRLYLLNMLESDLPASFHLHANVFNLYPTTHEPGPTQVTDIVTLSQAERCILEFSYRHKGLYMFHPHQNAFAEKGCMGCFEVVD